MSGGSRVIPIDSGTSVPARDDAILELGGTAEAAAARGSALPEPAMPGTDQAAADTPASEAFSADARPLESPAEQDWWSQELPETGRNQRRIAAGAAIAAVTGWTGFFGYAIAPAVLAGTTPVQWTAWISQWALPVVLVCALWLVVMRGGKREAQRHAAEARTLAETSALLEDRLARMNGELSIAREFIAAQSLDLEALGRIALERLDGAGAKLERLVKDNGARVDQIGSVSAAALDNMEKLRGQLPVVASSARDATNHIANAGRTAHMQIEDMIAGFQRLNEFGTASERQVVRTREQVNEAIAALNSATETMADAARTRFEALAGEAAAAQERLDERESAALAALARRFGALAGEIEARHGEIAAVGETASTALTAQLAQQAAESAKLTATLRANLAEIEADLAGHRARHEDHVQLAKADLDGLLNRHGGAMESHFAALDNAISERRASLEATAAATGAALDAQSSALDRALADQRQRQDDQISAMAAAIDDLVRRARGLTELLHDSGTRGGAMADAINRTVTTLNQKLAEARKGLAGTDLEISALTEGAVRLLELVRGTSEHSSTLIPDAVRVAETALKGIEARVNAMAGALGQASEDGRLLAERVDAGRAAADAARADYAATRTALVEQMDSERATLEALQAALDKARHESEALVQQAEGAVGPALDRFTAAARLGGQALRANAEAEIPQIADSLAEALDGATRRVLQGRAADLVGKLEAAIDQASEATRESALALTDQLAKVDELAANLESRVDRARRQGEEQVDNDFARRAALITESLNSTAIDIAKALSTDVSETAWAAYLRGDRGVFTRRAVTLLDNGEARSIQRHYEADHEFRGQVNRYIHDFEAMLRQLLATRNGNALGVTLLSSDMGKLYVALAQGIERLRS